MIFFSRLEFVPAQINGQKNTIAARDRGLWVGCTAVLLYCCTEIPVRCRQIQYVLHLSTPHLRTRYGFFFSLVPLASEVVLNGGRTGASGPRPSGALVTIHITGVFANIISGMFSDRFGSKNVLIIFAISSSALSFTIGWVTEWYWVTILIISFLYSFFTLGDSGVLTAALTDVTKRNVLGRSLAFRSIIGIGFGSITPSIFGFIMDVSNSYLPLSKNTNWIYAFSFLGISGLIASYYATKLNRIALSRSL